MRSKHSHYQLNNTTLDLYGGHNSTLRTLSVWTYQCSDKSSPSQTQLQLT